MVQTYREALQCEALRAEIFAGKRAPLIFGDPAPWIVQLVEAVRLEAEGGHAEQVAQMRAQALEAAPASPGSINGERFEWLADTDQRLGPVLEAIVNGKYFWIPLHRLHKIEIEAPSDLRDAVWTAAMLTLSNGGEAVALIPTRYNGTETSSDAALLMARRTEWLEGNGQGLGQRMFATDVADYALMDIRSIEFDLSASEAEAASEPDASNDDAGQAAQQE
jgi:type VI secretion system protein ImpE